MNAKDAMPGRKQKQTPNVFRDLGFPPDEAQNLLLRAELLSEVREVIRKRRITQRDAARLMGVTQPRISDAVRGRIDRFTIDSLVEMLSRAGITVRMRVERPRRAKTVA